MDIPDVSIPSANIYSAPPPSIYSAPPPSIYSAPQTNPSINIYEQRRAYMQKLGAERRQYIDRKLKEGLPVKFLIFHIVLVLIAIAVAVGMQTVSIVTKLSIWFICHGYVMSLFYLLLIAMCVFLIIKRTYCLLLLTVIIHLIGSFVSIAVLTIISGIAMTEALCYQSFVASSAYPSILSCKSLSFIYPNVVLLVLGILSCIWFLVFACVLSCTILCARPKPKDASLNTY